MCVCVYTFLDVHADLYGMGACIRRTVVKFVCNSTMLQLHARTALGTSMFVYNTGEQLIQHAQAQAAAHIRGRTRCSANHTALADDRTRTILHVGL